MNKYALIVAAGSGSRMGSNLPKQFLQLGQRPLLWHTLQAFLSAYADLKVVLVLPADFMEEGQRIADSTLDSGRIQTVAGGKTRFHSVQNGLEIVEGGSVVFVHDGVRCLVSRDLIQRCYQQALELGSAIPAVAPVDSVRMVSGQETRAMERSAIRLVQTPQTFLTDLLKKAFAQPYQESFTDEASVVEQFGTTIHLVEGEISNIKITRPLDLALAEILLSQRNLP